MTNTSSSWALQMAQSLTVGIIGPRELSPEGAAWVDSELQREIERESTDTTKRRIMISLASPIEQAISAHALDSGFELEAVIPSENFGAALEASERIAYDALLARASDTTTLTYATRTEAALAGAAMYIVYYADVVLAVLDGDERQRADRGASIVREAQVQGRRLVVIDPLERTIVRPPR